MLLLNESLVEDLAVGLNTEGFGLDSSKLIIAPKVSKELCSSNHHFGDNITAIIFHRLFGVCSCLRLFKTYKGLYDTLLPEFLLFMLIPVLSHPLFTTRIHLTTLLLEFRLKKHHFWSVYFFF